MKKKLIFVLGVLFLCFLSGCQTEIEVDLPDYQTKLVVEGYIENGEVPIVMISKSIPYFSSIDINYLLKNVLITDAVVTVTASDGESEQLTLQYNDKSPYYIAYVGKNLKGQLNTDYTLNIKWKDREYSAKTSILHTFDLDSIGFSSSNELYSDTMKSVRALFTDNSAEINYYQFMIKIHGKDLHDRLWVTTLPVTFDDATFSGKPLTFEILRANPSAILMPEMNEEERKNYFRMTCRPGDTVYVKYALIDYESYKFWTTGGNELAMGQNPFLSPSPVHSNLRGKDVLGVWCGYAAKVATLIYRDTLSGR